VTTADVVDRVNEKHDLAYTVVRPMAEGEASHATLVVDTDGGRCVLKWWPGDDGDLAYVEAAAERVDRLRVRGYPAPRYVLISQFDGVVLVIQELLDGRPPLTLLPAHVDQLIALNELQRGTEPHAPAWGEYLRSTLLNGADGYCLHEPLRQHSARSTALLDRVIAVGRETLPDELPALDTAHIDFHHLNVLVTGDTVTGIIDCEGARAGDRMFDLVTLLFCSSEGGLDQATQERMWSLLEAERRPAVLSAYLAHMALRLTSWSIVHHDDATTARWLDRSESTLDRITPARSARLPPAAGAAPSASS
jgi:Ser/Thr protein kinase RdoA (MazF antagonist)